MPCSRAQRHSTPAHMCLTKIKMICYVCISESLETRLWDSFPKKLLLIFILCISHKHNKSIITGSDLAHAITDTLSSSKLKVIFFAQFLYALAIFKTKPFYSRNEIASKNTMGYVEIGFS